MAPVMLKSPPPSASGLPWGANKKPQSPSLFGLHLVLSLPVVSPDVPRPLCQTLPPSRDAQSLWRLPPLLQGPGHPQKPLVPVPQDEAGS